MASKSIARRIAKVVAALVRSKHSLNESCLKGGLTPGVALRARFAGYDLEGEPGETADEFYARASTAANAVKAKFVVYGGLPSAPLEWSEPPGLQEALAKAGRSGDEMDRDP